MTLPRLNSAQWTCAVICAASMLAVAPMRASAQMGRQLGSPTWTAPVRAAAGPSEARGADWTFDLTATTSLPLSVGVEANLQSPFGVAAYISVGHTPGAYLEMVDDLLRGAGAYGGDVEPLIRESIDDGAWNVRLGLGYSHPIGFEISGGYTHLTLSSDVSMSSIEAALGQYLPWSGTTAVPLTVAVHALTARVGWRFVIEDHLVLRAALGWTYAVDVAARFEVPAALRDHPRDPAGEMERAVAAEFSEYGFTPELILSVGYRF